MAPWQKKSFDFSYFDLYALRDLLRFSGGRKVIDYFRDMDRDESGELTKKECAKAPARPETARRQ